MILDIAMPKLNGIEVTSRATKMDRPPAVIILTMYLDESYVDAGARGGRPRVSAQERRG